MHFAFRRASKGDYYLFQQCFDNEEFVYNIGLVDPLKILSLKSPHVVLIVSLHKQKEYKDIGFCVFYCQEKGSFLYLGGLLPDYFNTGYGLYSSVAVINFMFDKKDVKEINTVVYNHNERSLRMLLSIGFLEIRKEENFRVLKLINNKCPNKFVRLINKKVDYQAS